MPHLPTGLVLWRGPSKIDGKPIVAIATGLLNVSANRATGPAIQVWFLRSRVAPIAAKRKGHDRSICGDCVHRSGTCYVTVWREVTQVYKSYRQGVYTPYRESEHAHFIKGHAVRYGAYGDPAAVPLDLTRRINALAGTWLSYTHQWDQPWCDPNLKNYCMASVDSAQQRERALSLGWQTFRVRTADEPVETGEFVCPKSAEAGQRLLCIHCRACSGGEWQGEATPVCILHAGLPHAQRRFADDPRRFITSLAVV